VVALDGDAVIGAAAVTGSSIASHAHLTPWLTGLWTAPPVRRRGVASAVIGALVEEAGRLGVKRLHVATQKGRALFERLD
jgi:GNAT superfamily N-acetyltransferase